MNKISKAIGAGTGGAITGAGLGALYLPEGSPWYAYPIMIAVSGLVPAITAFFAPKNAG